ncbi:Prostatic acid phosphatase [Aphelenchoides besseyi]|nr:Prostatic acid phosphatase [Aphelenchoides besseyi]
MESAEMDATKRSMKLVLIILLLLTGVEAKLETAQIWFRHGQRFPTAYLTFPTDDKRVLAEAQKYDRGELTNVGVSQTYDLGRNLRETYSELVGKTYRSTNLITFTGRDNRTVASGLGVLAGLFPPSAAQSWNGGLRWIPIPVFSLEQLDQVSFGILDFCPHYLDTINDTRSKAVFDYFSEIASVLSKQTGVKIENIDVLQKVIDGVLARNNLAPDYLPLPQWAEDEAFVSGLRQVQNILHQNYIRILGDEPGAWQFDRLIGTFDDYINNRTLHKLVLYSAHDSNMMTFGIYLNISIIDEELQPLATYLAFELHSDEKNETDYRVKIYLHRQLNGTRELLNLKQCPYPCSFSKFKALGSRISTTEFVSLCKDTTEDSTLLYKTVSGVLIIVTVLLLAALISVFWSCQSWKRRYETFVEEERQPLISRNRSHRE